MGAKEKIFTISVHKSGGRYLALCPELGVEAGAETKEKAKTLVAQMIVAKLGQKSGGDESVSPPTPSRSSFWQIFPVAPVPSADRKIKVDIAARMREYLPASTLALGGLVLLWAILSLM